MLHQVIADLSAHLEQNFPADRPYPPAAFRRAPMPGPVVHFLEHTLAAHLEEEVQRVRAAQSAWFAHDHPDVQQAHRTLIDALVDHARIPRDEWGATLRRAVEVSTTYLVCPLETLVDFVFDGEDALPSSVILRRQQYVQAYPYLLDVARVFFERKPDEQLSRTRYRELLESVDRTMVRQFDESDWARLLDPLYGQLDYDGTDGVAIDLLIAFFEEREHEGALRRLRVLQEGGTDRIKLAHLGEVLADVSFPAEPPAEEAPSAPAQEPTEEEPPVTEPAAPSGPVPLWQQFHQRHQSPAPRPETPEPAAGVPRWKQFRQGSREAVAEVLAQEEQSAPTHETAPARTVSPDATSTSATSTAPSDDLSLRTLERAVLGRRGPRNRKHFVKHLFGGSEADYRRTLEQLTDAPTWPSASQIIAKEVFQRHGVNIYSDTAVTFTDAVEATFR